MDELLEFCARVLGDREAAAAVARSAREAAGDERLAALAQAVKECRARGGSEPAAAVSSEPAGEPVAPVTGDPAIEPASDGNGAPAVGELAAAVAAELSAAAARLPPRQREALALRELLGLSHEQLSFVLGIEPAAAAPLLARSRLRLRAELRGAALARGDCPERDRMLRVATLRQDGEPVSIADEDWLIDHLGHCSGCIRAHSGMLEGSACYRGWRVTADPAAVAADGTAST